MAFDASAHAVRALGAQGALFRMQLAAAEEEARKVALGTGPHVGAQLLSPAEVKRMQRQRAEQQRRHQRREELRATQRQRVGDWLLPAVEASKHGPGFNALHSEPEPWGVARP
jgi:hypothetical protein